MPRNIDKKQFLKEQRKKSIKKKPKKKKVTFKGRRSRIAIREAALTLKQIEITYKKTTTGEIKTYRVSPYSYRYKRLKIGVRKMLYAEDMKARHIKGYSLRNITKVTILPRRTYKPKWDVEII